MDKLNLEQGFAGFDELWAPRVAAAVNDTHVKLVKLEGEFHWHHHESEDELFLVHRGVLEMRFRDRTVVLNAGELIVVPRGVEHMPVALSDPCEVILIEPSTTLNTGNVVNERTVTELESI